MTGWPKRHYRRTRTATGPQLWRLNRRGRLQIVDEAVPINSAEASAQLDIELAKEGLERFADTKTARRHAELAADAQSVNSDPPA